MTLPKQLQPYAEGQAAAKLTYSASKNIIRRQYGAGNQYINWSPAFHLVMRINLNSFQLIQHGFIENDGTYCRYNGTNQ